MSNLTTRIITALIGVSLMITGIVFSSWSFAAVFLIIALLSLKEFYGLARKSGSNPFEIWGIVFSAIIFVMVFLNQQGEITKDIFWVLPALFSTVFIYPLMRLEQSHAINCLAISILGVLYITLPFSLVFPIAYTSGVFDYEIIIGMLFTQWANDTGAYFAGKAIGKTKLFEKVSPNKTWEGAIGGLVLSIAISQVFCYFFGGLTYIEWAGLAIVVSTFGTIGDLVESLFKRTLAIKDSGSTIPGHGGFLDRFDGLLLALPFVLAYLTMIN